MKRHLIVLFAAMLIVAVVSPAMAFNQGQWRVGGGSSFSYSSIDDDETEVTTTETDIYGTAGYFFMPRLEAGLGLLSSSIDVEDGAEVSYTAFAPYGRYYFPLQSGDNLYAGGGIAIYGGDLDGNSIFFQGGYNWMITTDTAVEFGAQFDTGDFTGLSLGAGISLFF